MVTILRDWNSEVSGLTVVSWCCGSPNDVTFRAFSVSHYHKVQVFIQPLQILFLANECKISVGLSVPTNSLTTFDLIKQEFNWHEPTNRQLTNFVGLSVLTNSLANFVLIKRERGFVERGARAAKPGKREIRAARSARERLLKPPQFPSGFSALALLYYFALPTKTAMLRGLTYR